MDLSTTYLGLKLKNPLIASASPLTASLNSILELEKAGIAAVVMHSLFEEQIAHESRELDHFLSSHSDSYAEAINFFPHELEFENIESNNYIKEITAIKEATTIPIIASLNGASLGGWVKYAKRLQEAGADALELNITYIPTDIDMSGAEVEAMYIEIIKSVREAITIPMGVKMNAYFSNPANMAKRFVDAGANGLVLFDNPVRVDIDLEALSPTQRANITSSKTLSETLRWCAILDKRLDVSLCANSGVHCAEDVLKAIMSGADAVSFASVLLIRGVGEVKSILEQLEAWMSEKEYESIKQMKGSISLANSDNPAAYERASYMGALQNYRA